MKKYFNNITLFLILIISAILRLWYIGWGLPLKKAHIDESVVIFYTMRFLTGDLNPHVFFDYPTLFLYILGILLFIAFLIGKIFGVFISFDQFFGIYLFGDASFIYIIARLLSASFGVGSVYLLYKISKENLSKGLLPAFILAITPMFVIHSHYATVDVACVFFVLLAFLFWGRYYRTGEDKHILTGSFILGLATAVKYYPIVFFVPMLYFIYQKNKLKINKYFAPLLCIFLGFITGCPYSILDFTAFINRFLDRFQLIVWTPNTTFDIFNIFSPINSIISALSLPLLLFLLFGIIISLKQYNKNVIFWLSFPLFFLLFVETWNIKSSHYIMPILPFLIFLGSYGFDSIRGLNDKLKTLIIILLCLSPAISIYKFERMLTFRDTRLEAYSWIKNNLPKGSRILRLPYTPEFYPTDPFIVKVDWESKTFGVPPEILSIQYDYLIITKPSDNNAKQWETNLLNYYKIIGEWDNASIDRYQFHNPYVILYGKKI